nr:transformation/transcription domain-associated protein isoform X1 [Ciona intestinalis]XP_018666779.1 transformation/transcription domain-associated protein isoform X2 [Ciona intestinalis]|eukprot:XP_018666778.1 transformation/transcription domain-associated protein isoform X1 [Ciona intestinalis]
MLQTPATSDLNQDIVKYQSYLTILNSPSTPDENKLKAAQEISERFEDLAQSPKYSEFLSKCVINFIKLLQDGEPQFISENPSQQLRKLVLDILHRIPTNDHLRPHVKNILNLCFQLLEVDNEENVQVCIKIIIELHKQFRPQIAPEIQNFLSLVKRIYGDLPQNMIWLFENPTIREGGLPDPQRIGTVTQVTFRAGIPGNPSPGGKTVTTVIPKALNSMKVLQEIPITVVLMYQLYKQATQNVVAEFIPLIMKTLLLQPSQAARVSSTFNHELFVDFTAAQVKTLSFVAFFVRLYQENIKQYSNEMVQAMLQLLTNCTPEVASLRKELLIAVRHILATDLKTRFVPHMDRLLNEDILIGTGWSARETLRTLAYSTLADLTHHVRGQLSLAQLSSAVHLFAKNVHDDSLPSSFQTISCKLLLHLVEGITKKSESEKLPQQGRENLMRMLEVFVLKFRMITKHVLPTLFSKCKQVESSTASNGSASASGQTDSTTTNASASAAPFSLSAQASTSAAVTSSSQLPSSKSPELDKELKPDDSKTPGVVSVADCRSLVKTLVCGVKTITWGAGSCKAGKDTASTSGLGISASNKQFLPEETELFVKLVRYALKALDIYQINVASNGQMSVRPSNCPTMRMKEEKEVLEHFAGVFTMMNPLTFREIFSATITYVVDRIHNNYALQIVANSFLASPHTSATFATILVEFLLERLEDMGKPGEQSNLYLKLFKLVFGSVSLFANENEQMLKPHLHTIVTKSMALANTAHDPYNYFLLLRALFRSIGGGSHDSLYREFLPLLPNLLQGLNSLQSGLHKQHMKDLFVELCLTVPVRLSSLLPYLPMLMDPLVSALNGSQTLITQGLRTLELCVDNLQPDFLYDHIQPVRAELMQALWRTLRNPSDDIAHVAFRVLGKFGGSNRKMLKEAQRLAFDDSGSIGPCVKLRFVDCKGEVPLPVKDIIGSALKCLKSPNTEHYYRRQSFEVIKCFLIGMMNNGDSSDNFSHLIRHSSFTKDEFTRMPASALYKCQDSVTRNAFKQALTGAFMCAVIKDLRKLALPFVAHIVRHYTLVAIAQQAGPFPITTRQNKRRLFGYNGERGGMQAGMDPLVLVDAIAECMAYEEKELCKIGNIAILLMVKVGKTVLGSCERSANLPIFSYVVERMCACCYDRAWYAKYGGCCAIQYLMQQMPIKWILEQQYVFLRALLFVMMDLTNEVSSGAVDLAKDILKELLIKCATPLTGELAEDQDALRLQQTSFNRVMHELVREVTSPNKLVREQAVSSLQILAETSGHSSVTDIMSPHRDVLSDMIPPRKHLLRHQPVNTQIGLMDGNTFCNSLRPRLFTLDLSVKEHKVFFTELFHICEADDAALKKLACYKNVASLIPLRMSAMKALSVLYYIPQVKEKIINVLFKQLGSESKELMTTAEECIRQFLKGTESDGKLIETDVIHNAMRPTLLKMGDYRNLTLTVVHHLAALSRLFPNTFNEKLCEQLFAHLTKWLDTALLKQASTQTTTPATTNGQDPKTDVTKELELCAAILEIFHLIPLAPQALLEPLIVLVVKTEAGLMLEVGSPLRTPLLCFLTRHADAALNIFLLGAADRHWNRLLISFLKRSDKNGEILREHLEKKAQKILSLCFAASPDTGAMTSQMADLQYFGILVIWILSKHNPQFLSLNMPVVNKLHEIWIRPEFHKKHEKETSLNCHFDEARLLCKCLLRYASKNPSDVGLQFQLLRAFSTRTLTDFQFLKSWFEEHVPNNYSMLQKRMIFFKFVELYHEPSFPSDLKALAIQHIVIPVFRHAFDNNESEQLIGGPPNPEVDNPNDCISVFINRVIDPDKPYAAPDAVQIQLLRFLSLLVDRASPYIHDPSNKSHGDKLRRIMTFAWPCLLPRNCVDPASKYHGHLLLSHIIGSFGIRKRIVLQTFYSLLKAHAVEARTVVRQALDVLTPAMPARMEDGNQMLTHWTRKIIVEEGHTLAQLMHVLLLIVRHHRVYYPVNSGLVQQMIASMQRLGFAPNTNMEQRRLAVDVAEVLIKWEIRRISEEQEANEAKGLIRPVAALSIKMDPVPSSTHRVVGLDKKHSDTVVNFLLRMTCQVNESSGGSAEILSRRCVVLLRSALRADVWPKSDLHLLWVDKLLLSVDPAQQGNTGSICTGLELINLILSLIPKDSVISTVKPLQKGIAACMTCSNVKVIRSVQSLLVRLFSLFPPTAPPANHDPMLGQVIVPKVELSLAERDLEVLFSAMENTVLEGLNEFEKAGTTSTGLFSTLMILKAACTHTPAYIDHLLATFVRVFQKLVKEHLQSPPQSGQTGSEVSPFISELIVVCLDLAKCRVVSMAADTRRSLMHGVFSQIIERSTDPKLIKAVIRIMDEWLKARASGDASQAPTLREISPLLLKLMNIDKRFTSEHLDIHTGFLDLVNYVYRDESLSGSELTSKLEPAFLSGLRCTNPTTRRSYFEVFDNSIPQNLYDRLLYMICSQNWEAMGTHYWIKQCIEMIFAVCDRTSTVMAKGSPYLLPSITHVITLADPADRDAFNALAKVKTEPMDIDVYAKEEEVESMMETSEDDSRTKTSNLTSSKTPSSVTTVEDRSQQLNTLITRHCKFLESLSEAKSSSFLLAAAQLCHNDTQLSHAIWCRLFPKIWSTFTNRQQSRLSGELSAFVCSGAHLIQKDCQPSAVHTIVEALTSCVPVIPLKPPVIKYLGKTHNLWFRCSLVLERLSSECGADTIKPKTITAAGFEPEPINTRQQEVLDALCDLYSLLREEDMWTGLWQKRCSFPDTAKAMAYEQQGFFEQAQATYESLMSQAREEHNKAPAPYSSVAEYKVWEEHWIRCCQELNQWEVLNEYGSCKSVCNPHLVVECAWRLPDWNNMKDALVQVELSYPKEMAWKVNMYRGFLAICHPEEHQLNLIERMVDLASSQAIKEWKRIPRIVSHIHTPLLQAAQQIIELQEAAQVHQSLQPNNIGRSNSLHDMKAIVKTWRNRLPMTSDDLSHWSDIFTWRHHHYQAIVQAYDTASASQQDPNSTHAMLGVHASASAIIHYGKVARKHGQINSALDSLSRIHSIPSVPIVDCFQKIRQQVKCYLQMAAVMGKNECMQGLEVIESTNLKYFTHEMTAEFYALKGMFLAQIGKSDEANKAFSAAVQMHDVLVKAWALWGDYLESVFLKQNGSPPSSVEQAGVSAITCYLHACRHQNEHKSRKYLAKVIWLLSYDDEQCTLADAVDKYSVGVPSIQWLAWVPQILTCLVCGHGAKILNLLSHVARVYPQAVYFPIRTLYLTLKIEQRERYKSAEALGGGDKKVKLSTDSQVSEGSDSQTDQPDLNDPKSQSLGSSSGSQASGDSGPIRATPSMWRCSRIMHMQRDLHPTLLSSLEGIVDQMVWFRENWHEEVLRQLCQGLAKCYTVAFENRAAVSQAHITPHTLNFVKKLVSTFGVGIENVANVTQTFSSAASESLARRVQATAQDPVFQKMKNQFTTDFDFDIPGSMKLHNVIQKLKKWIRILEAKTKMMPKSFLIEEKCRFLSNFSASTAEVEIPGEFLMPKHTHYYVKIARFMPRVHVVQKHNTAARRLYIRGHNGKVYPYLVMNDGCLIESRREERVLQLLRLLNPGLEKRKETAKRQLLFTVPRVVAVSPQMRLVEDNPSSLSLLDIYKLRCVKKSVEHDLPIGKYYERLTSVQARGLQVSHHVLRDILRDVQTDMVPRTTLKEWAVNAFPDATDYWTFRKSFSLHLALLGFAEFALHLTRLRPEMMQIAQDSGHLHAAYFRFDMIDSSGELNTSRAVPFRLTPNIAEFVSPVGVNSVLTAAMIATARCFMQPNFKVKGLFRAVLRDEVISWHKKRQDENGGNSQPTTTSSSTVPPPDMDSEQLVTLVNRAVTSIMTRLERLAQMDRGESTVATLVEEASSSQNLCRMDPAWHPWL